MMYLKKLADRYFLAWTSDGIDEFHTDASEIAAWLKREDLRTSEDADLEDLTYEEIEKLASMIAEMVVSAKAEMKTYYILQDMEGYGSEYPICVDKSEADRLCKAWDTDFDETWREATEYEIATYGRYDTEED